MVSINRRDTDEYHRSQVSGAGSPEQIGLHKVNDNSEPLIPKVSALSISGLF